MSKPFHRLNYQRLEIRRCLSAVPIECAAIDIRLEQPEALSADAIAPIENTGSSHDPIDFSWDFVDTTIVETEPTRADHAWTDIPQLDFSFESQDLEFIEPLDEMGLYDTEGMGEQVSFNQFWLDDVEAPQFDLITYESAKDSVLAPTTHHHERNFSSWTEQEPDSATPIWVLELTVDSEPPLESPRELSETPRSQTDPVGNWQGFVKSISLLAQRTHEKSKGPTSTEETSQHDEATGTPRTLELADAVDAQVESTVPPSNDPTTALEWNHSDEIADSPPTQAVDSATLELETKTAIASLSITVESTIVAEQWVSETYFEVPDVYLLGATLTAAITPLSVDGNAMEAGNGLWMEASSASLASVARLLTMVTNRADELMNGVEVVEWCGAGISLGAISGLAFWTAQERNRRHRQHGTSHTRRSETGRQNRSTVSSSSNV